MKFDYLFAIDKVGIEQYYDAFFDYDCIKFVGDQNLGIHYQIPETIIHGTNIRRYKTTAGYMDSRFSVDIECEPLGNFCTVSLQALQFILYTQPKRIYLVGIDCTQGRHFVGESPNITSRGESPKNLSNNAIKQWKDAKEFIAKYYPHIETISINPVSLKGLFRDICTQDSSLLPSL